MLINFSSNILINFPYILHNEVEEPEFKPNLSDWKPVPFLLYIYYAVSNSLAKMKVI